MARQKSRPIFLGQARYRQRRLHDAARLLPFLGAVLWIMIPLLWPRGLSDRISNADALIYMFAVWVVLIVLAQAISRRLVRDEDLVAGEDADG